jgi:hypothetical protein
MRTLLCFTGLLAFSAHAQTLDIQKSILDQALDSHPGPLTIPRSLFGGRYAWHTAIGTTVFWVGELPRARDPGNLQSAWDPAWLVTAPRQNPFYVALPYNDVDNRHTKPEAAQVIPWFRESFIRDGQSVLKGRWVAIRHGNKTCYAQWEDVGPFRTDHWQYVFGNERPRPNRNHDAGLDVSPAVRDYLRLSGIDVCDWRFIDRPELGPWTSYAANTFAGNGR